MNIATIQAEYITSELVKKFDLVPQKHDENKDFFFGICG